MGNVALVMKSSMVVPVSSCDMVISRTSSKEMIKQPKSQRLTQNIAKEVDQDIREFYEIDNQPVLGSGLNGQVKMCVHKATKLNFALKTLSKKGLSPERILRLRNEVGCMSHLDHPNILRVHEVFETDDCIYLVMELCRGGHLMDRLFAQQGRYFREKVACKYIYTVLNAVAHCHAHNVVHRDLKLENILFETEGRESGIKLIDFGLSQYQNPRESMRKYVGTSYYVAPEVIDGNYDAKCDVWSIGVIAYMLLSGVPPFYGATDADTLVAIKLGDWQFDEYLFNSVSAEAKDFISKCLTRRPFWRMSAATALKHKWFSHLQPKKCNLPSVDMVHRFSSFIVRSTLAKIFMDVIAHTLLPDQVTDLREQFDKFDVSRSGMITVNDLRTVMRRFKGFKEEYLNVILANLDLDRKGEIGYHEFLAATIRRRNVAEENLQIAFEIISNHGEVITSGDIQALLGNSTFDLSVIMEEVGLDMDSKITFPVFKAILDSGDEGLSYLDMSDVSVE